MVGLVRLRLGVNRSISLALCLAPDGTAIPNIARQLQRPLEGSPSAGRIAPGAFADLVLLDTATVIDHVTPADPHVVSTGVAKVWVNGTLAFVDGRTTGSRSGRALRR